MVKGRMLVFSVCRKPLPESTKRSEKCPASHSCWEMRFHMYIMQKGTVLPDRTVFGFVCTAKWKEGLMMFRKWHWTSAISVPHGTDWSCGIHCWSFLLFHRTCSTGLNSLPFVRLGDFPWFNVKKGCCWRSILIQFTLKLWKQCVYVCLLQGCVPQLPDAFTFMDFPLQQFVIIHTQLTPSLTHTLQAAQAASKGITVRHLVPVEDWEVRLCSGTYLGLGFTTGAKLGQHWSWGSK